MSAVPPVAPGAARGRTGRRAPQGPAGSPSSLHDRSVARRDSAWAVLRTARPRQWPKNLLVLAAPLAATSTGRDGRGPADLALAVAAFTLAAAAGYFVNDLADLDRDRRHPGKRQRPLASGEMTPTQGRLWAALFALGALAVATAVPGWGFTAVLGG